MLSCLVEITDEIREFLQDNEVFDKYAKNGRIEVDDLCRVNSTAKNPLNLSKLLSDQEKVSIYRENIKPEPLSDIQQIRQKQEERIYMRKFSSGKQGQPGRSEIVDFQKSYNLGFGYIITMIGGFLTGYLAAETFGLREIGTKVLFGGLTMFLTLLVETLLLIIRDQKSTKGKSE